MNVETFFEARDLYEKYQLCEKVLEYLSDEESVKGQKYLETLKQFVDTFRMKFMMFVHERMEAVGMQFEELHCPEHSEQPDTPEPPTEEKEPKFPIGSKVEIIEGIGKGDVGVVKDYNPTVSRYYVVSDNFYMWFPESDLKAYVEESEENPEEPNPIFNIGDKVYVNVNESALDEDDKEWHIGVIVGYEESTNIYVVDVKEGDNVTYTFNVHPDQLELYTDPENPEDNGGTDTPDEGEQ